MGDGDWGCGAGADSDSFFIYDYIFISYLFIFEYLANVLGLLNYYIVVSIYFFLNFSSYKGSFLATYFYAAVPVVEEGCYTFVVCLL